MDAHNRVVMMFIELGLAFHRERQGRSIVYTSAIMEKAYEDLIDIYSCLRTGWKLQSSVLEGSPIHQAKVQPQGAGAWQCYNGGGGPLGSPTMQSCRIRQASGPESMR